MKDFDLRAIENQCEHVIKINPPYSDQQIMGNKTFEVRLNDRPYKVGDFVMMKEFDRESEKFTGRFVVVRVTSLLSGDDFDGVESGYVVMSTKIKLSGNVDDL